MLEIRQNFLHNVGGTIFSGYELDFLYWHL